VKLKCIALAVAAFVLPSTLLLGAEERLGELIREDMRTSCDKLLDTWLAAGASHPDASQPLFQAAVEQLLAIRDRASAAIGNGKVVVLDKARLAELGDIREVAYRYTRATDTLEFSFPFTTWQNQEIVIVTDSRMPDADGLSREFRIDYQIQITDRFSALAAVTVYEALVGKDPAVARTVVRHIFGPWYAEQAIAHRAQK
jgi:hypothetical protein